MAPWNFERIDLLYTSNQTSFCGEYDFAVLPPKRLGSSPNAAAEVFFHSERSGHLEVGWSEPKKGAGTEQGSSVKNCNLWLTLFLMVFHTGCNLRIIHFFKPWIEVGLWPLGVAVAR